MEEKNDLRWIPCSEPAWNVAGRGVGAAPAEDLLLQYAIIVAHELSARGVAADVGERAISDGAGALPIIQIG